VVVVAVEGEDEAAVVAGAAVAAPPEEAAAALLAAAELRALVVHREVPLHAHLPCRGLRRLPSDVQVEAAVPASQTIGPQWATCRAQAIDPAQVSEIARVAGTSPTGQRRGQVQVHAQAQVIWEAPVRGLSPETCLPADAHPIAICRTSSTCPAPELETSAAEANRIDSAMLRPVLVGL
jgi:hypothetical protein